MPGRACRSTRRSDLARGSFLPLLKLSYYDKVEAKAELPHSLGRSLEKEKTLAAPRRQLLFEFGNVRQLSPFEGRERVVLKQSVGFLPTKPIDNHVVRGLQTKRPRPRIVRIAGHEMNDTLADPAQRILLSAGTKASRQRASGDLHEATMAHPLFQALRMGAQNAVALRMGDHRPHAGKLNFVQRLVHRRWYRKLAELHQQKIALVDTKLPGIFPQRCEILGVQMKIAARHDIQPVADFGLQFVSELAYLREIEKIFTAGVRSGNHVRDSIGNRRLRHRQGFFHGGRAIIESRQNVTVQIDHSNEPSLAPPGVERLPRTEENQCPRKNLAHPPRLDAFG